MSINSRRDWATSLSGAGFVVIAISGLMMFFHFYDSFVKSAHEFLGLAFIVAVGWHIFVNFKSMRGYFGKKIFAIASSLIGIATLIFILTSVFSNGQNPKQMALTALLNAPASKSLPIFGGSFEEAKIKLEKNGFKIEENETLKDAAKRNKTSPFALIALLK